MPLKGSQFFYCHIVNGLSLSIIEGKSDIDGIPQDSDGTSNVGNQDVIPAVVFFVFGSWCFHLNLFWFVFRTIVGGRGMMTILSPQILTNYQRSLRSLSNSKVGGLFIDTSRALNKSHSIRSSAVDKKKNRGSKIKNSTKGSKIKSLTWNIFMKRRGE